MCSRPRSEGQASAVVHSDARGQPCRRSSLFRKDRYWTILCFDECTEGEDAGKHPPARAIQSAQTLLLRFEMIVGMFGVLLQSSPGKAGSHSFLENFYRCFLLFNSSTHTRKSDILNAPCISLVIEESVLFALLTGICRMVEDGRN